MCINISMECLFLDVVGPITHCALRLCRQTNAPVGIPFVRICVIRPATSKNKHSGLKYK